ncbi:hypothetical protein NBRC10513v2_000259 [Rhodotorula toruloides]|uniref:BY PROTMAP: gi/472587164/gb/EMS24663.1/ zinc metalloprotease [Rhodosporidium toruloides NP11] gi/647394649/emb/CDR35882.1/ RHTO0S01e09318g1_1 [Rhodosporidium toruloides] n=2 Tax=Rhodotorula toruloides TaxID=5286 RepID=A0A0K3C6Y5_RHOTO
MRRQASLAASTVYTDSESYGERSPPPSPVSPLAPLSHKSPSGLAVPQRVGNFELIAHHQLEVPPYIQIAKYRSTKSGLKVIWADCPGTVCHFWTTLVTEVFSSNGTPHTKEHLTFTASKHWPFSGVLDALSNRVLSHGVNAWTDIDNTTYTFECASAEGMLKIVPVYLDHILFPLMTPEIFKTEIYHVDGTGHEGGVVFSEMQGNEGSEGTVLDLGLRRILYIKDFHSRMYVPQNMTVVVTGESIDPTRLLRSLDETEKNIAEAGLAKGPRPSGWIRPFVDSRTARNEPVLVRDIVKKVEYADSDESVGVVNLAWIGPSVDDLFTCAALDHLLSYLFEGSDSPICKKFVEIPDQKFSGCDTNRDVRDPNILSVCISAVPVHNIDATAGEVLDFLGQLCHVAIDMHRIQIGLKQVRLQLLDTLEGSSSSYIFDSVKQDIIYGAEDGSTLKDVFDDLEVLQRLAKLREKDWKRLLEQWLVDAHAVTLVAVPSAKLAKEQAAETTARVAANRQRLGPAGLARLAADLVSAKAANDHPPPKSLVKSFSVPDYTKIALPTVETARSNGVARGKETFSGPLQRKINRDVDLPFFVQFDHYESSFVTVSVHLHGPPVDLFSLWNSCFFAMPVKRFDGTVLPFQEAYRQLTDLAIEIGAVAESEGVRVSIRVPTTDYEEAVGWLADSLFGMQFDQDRLTTLIHSALQTLPDEKQDAASITGEVIGSLIYSAGSVYHPLNLLTRVDIFPKLLERLKSDAKGLIRDLEKLQETMLDPRAMRMHVSGDVMSLPKPTSPWARYFQRLQPFPEKQLAHLLRSRDLLTDVGKHPARKAVFYTIPSSESTYLVTRCACPDWSAPDYQGLSVAAAALGTANGLLWNAVRGNGLAYGAGMGLNVEAGMLGFNVFRSPDAFAAFEAARDLVDNIVSGKVKITEGDVEAAKSSLAYLHLASMNTLASVASVSFEAVIFGRPSHCVQRSLEKMKAVTLKDVLDAIELHIVKLFDPKSSIMAVSTNEEKRAELVANFRKAGYEVEEHRF